MLVNSKARFFLSSCILGLLLCACPARSHDLYSEDGHPHYDWSVHPPEQVIIGQGSRSHRQPSTAGHFRTPATAVPFSLFPDLVKLHWDSRFLYVESHGIPNHNMMVGITNWQQQVPIPQPYVGSNSWMIPLNPMPSSHPVSIRGRFLRGAIGLAVNGIPIFNPQNNRGEISQEIGELDRWGGHCGRADDYHYHAAPFHLQSVVGIDKPIAYALDGYPIYGLSEPDGSKPGGLDRFNGHTTPGLGYHYHGSKRYPYVNGGFHGQVTERGGQVDPQPQAQPIRPALPPLRGARITGFETTDNGKRFSLHYELAGRSGAINYWKVGHDQWRFRYLDPNGTRAEETYRSGGPQKRRGEHRPPPPPRRGDRPPPRPGDGWR